MHFVRCVSLLFAQTSHGEDRLGARLRGCDAIIPAATQSVTPAPAPGRFSHH